MKLIANLYDRRVAPLVAVVFAILFVMEGRRQLRKRRQPRFKRILINTVVALPAFTLFGFCFCRPWFGWPGKAGVPALD
jgi:hypothetical protein